MHETYNTDRGEERNSSEEYKVETVRAVTRAVGTYVDVQGTGAVQHFFVQFVKSAGSPRLFFPGCDHSCI